MGAGQQDKESLKKYIRIALVTFVTFCCCTLFFFVIYRYHGFAVYWQKLMKILQPIIIGFIVAYLINPVMVFIEKHSAISFALCVLFQASISSFRVSSCNIVITS